MKGSDFQAVCAAIADMLGSEQSAAAWRAFGAAFAAAPNASVSAILKAWGAAPLTGSDAEPTLDALLDQSGALLSLAELTAKPAALADLKRALEFAEANPDVSLQSLSAAPAPSRRKGAALDAEIVAEYMPRFEEALGKDQFADVLEACRGDRRVKLAEAKALSKQFAFASARSRADAMEKIWGRHAALIDGRKRHAAQKGRSAA